MDTKQVHAVLDWMKSTDLVEVAFKLLPAKASR